MKSILQLDRENQLDRQRRLLFCWCYARIEWHSAQTWRSRYWDAYSMIKLTVSLFVARLTQKRYYPAADMVWFSQYVPQWLYIAVLLWFTHAEDFPDGMALREPECTAPEYEGMRRKRKNISFGRDAAKHCAKSAGRTAATVSLSSEQC